MRRADAAFSPLIAISRKSARPLHRQIYDAFRSKIVGRTLRSGQPIPSTRALAAELGISRIPVLNAYAQLLAEGYFESRSGRGHFRFSFHAGASGAGGPFTRRAERS